MKAKQSDKFYYSITYYKDDVNEKLLKFHMGSEVPDDYKILGRVMPDIVNEDWRTNFTQVSKKLLPGTIVHIEMVVTNSFGKFLYIRDKENNPYLVRIENIEVLSPYKALKILHPTPKKKRKYIPKTITFKNISFNVGDEVYINNTKDKEVYVVHHWKGEVDSTSNLIHDVIYYIQQKDVPDIYTEIKENQICLAKQKRRKK